MSEPLVILVDEQDRPQGTAPKLLAHQQGLCHRAFSIFVMRKADHEQEVLLQQRQHTKYHSPGLWTNTCCSHPAPGESILDAATRRLEEEMGLTLSLFKEVGQFHYTAKLDNGLVENEFDHVLTANWAGEMIQPNPSEVADYRWMTLSALRADLSAHPERYTAWLALALAQLVIPTGSAA